RKDAEKNERNRLWFSLCLCVSAFRIHEQNITATRIEARTPMSETVGEWRVEGGGVECDDRRFAEVADGKVMGWVDRQDIQRITAKEGLLAPHPFFQIVLGAALSALGYFPAAHLYHFLTDRGSVGDGSMFYSAEALTIPLGLIGVWLILSVLRRGRYLEV